MSFAQSNNPAGLVGQDEMAAKRRLTEALKEIEQLHSLQISSLTTWLRHKDHPKSGTAQRALEQLANARREENLILKNVLGINPDQRALPRP